MPLGSIPHRLIHACKICAWIGIEHLADRTIGLGDDTAAIWVSKALIIP